MKKILTDTMQIYPTIWNIYPEKHTDYEKDYYKCVTMSKSFTIH